MDTMPTSGTATSTTDPRGVFETAYQSFVAALQEAGSPMDAQARAVDAYRLYAELVEQFWASDTVRLRAQQAQEAYLQAFRDAFSNEPVRTRTRQAFREFIRVTREAWMRLDPDEADPLLVGTMAQATLAVAGLAAGASDAASPSA